MLKIQEFISCFSSIEDANIHLSHTLALTIEESYLRWPKGESKIYIYNKGRHSDIDNPLVREANGLILNKNCSLVTKGPNHHYKIKNIKDLPDEFRLYKSNINEMTTGTMVTVFNYKGVWNISNKNSINDTDYSIDVKKTLNDHIDTWWTSVFDTVYGSYQNCIYIFDFISSRNKSVWPCTTFELRLISVLNNITGEELNPNIIDDIALKLDLSRPRHATITGRRSLSSFMSKARIPSKGFILDDGNIKAKISNTLYYSVKAAVEAKDNVEPIHIAKIFLACNDGIDKVLVADTFQNYKDFMDLFNKTINKVWQDMVIVWTSIERFSNDPKMFANSVPEHPLSYLLFMFKDKKIKTLLAGIKTIPAERLVEITKYKYEEEFYRLTRQLKTDNAYEDNILSKTTTV